MNGVLLNSRGEVETLAGVPMSLVENAAKGWQFDMRRSGGLSRDQLTSSIERAPAHVLDLLERGRAVDGPFGPRASNQIWEEVIYAIYADGAQVLNTTTETIMVPDFTVPAGYLDAKRILHYTIIGDVSTVITTPGTITFALRWGGVAGTPMATSGAFAPDPTAASTTQTCMVEYWVVARAVASSSASTFTVGRVFWGDYDDASATTIVGNLNMTMIPATAPAAVNLNTITANALSPTVKFSVATATTQFTAHMAFLESMS